MSRKVVFLIVFFLVLVVGFMATISVVLPNYFKPSIPPIGEVAPFSFTTQDGKPFTNNEMNGKVAAVEYFFTTCKGICPRMNNNMRKVYDELKNEKDFIILSHTCDQATDSAARLKQYADSMKVDTNKWVFLTGRKDSLYGMARHSYKIDDPANNVASIDDDFLHSQFVALVNKKGDVVKIFDALKPSEMKELIVDVKKLLNE